MLKITLSAFILSITLPVLAETQYFAGERVEGINSVPDARKSVMVIESTSKTTRVWSIIRCLLPGNTDCISYETFLKQEKDGKWTYSQPGQAGLVTAPIVTDSKNGIPENFKTSWNGTDGKIICILEHKTVGNKSVWLMKVHESGKWVTVTTTLSPMPKNIFMEIKNKRKATPLKF